jgi:hypothetical protein
VVQVSIYADLESKEVYSPRASSTLTRWVLSISDIYNLHHPSFLPVEPPDDSRLEGLILPTQLCAPRDPFLNRRIPQPRSHNLDRDPASKRRPTQALRIYGFRTGKIIHTISSISAFALLSSTLQPSPSLCDVIKSRVGGMHRPPLRNGGHDHGRGHPI